ncbi:hypothetical protein TSUD_42910 [Trifolium subterraneum]|uniref:Reverse transcriptase zinc-binding domain-containing protein n=1 Tax=Trifolium subterraneum TaxID=3900 RepID=A0A2Z6M3G0_TRISU|nr:hypothetical protein TSUD_42910 [Trifolium subterraneum]
MLRECQTLLLNFSFQVQSSDSWQWQPDLDTGYSVCGAYQLLTSQDSITLGEAETLIWHKQVHMKVSICAWRLLRDRLPTRANLVSRGIISPEAHFCVSGCGGIESAQHRFSHVGLLALYGRRFDSGLVFLRWIIKIHTVISSSLLAHWVSVAHGGLSCSSFGLLACGFCGMRETIGFSKI